MCSCPRRRVITPLRRAPHSLRNAAVDKGIPSVWRFFLAYEDTATHLRQRGILGRQKKYQKTFLSVEKWFLLTVDPQQFLLTEKDR
ncbi:hypothetical protein TNCV_3321271 [Trichonephila clavipes]|nr:hypothetical protein TNCV_3321271 [Trichonephila clavipes]